MADVLTLADARQLYSGCLLLYKEKIIYLISIAGDFKSRILYLETGKEVNVAFNTVDFQPIGNRLGFVNSNCCTFYLSRKPIRLFSVGITMNNLGIVYHRDCLQGGNFMAVLGSIQHLQIRELCDTINGIYPEFTEALELAKDFQGSYAFDRQFAIDGRANIFYKNKHVGFCKSKSVDSIEFKPGFEYLDLLIRGEHEKNPRNFLQG